jgi:hypothetical protein
MRRRAFLRGAVLAPAAAQMALKDAAAKVSGSAAVSMAQPTVEAAISGGQLTFTNFLKYALHNEHAWRKQANQVTHLDPDLLSMHLPLTTLFRLQRARNYERIKAESKISFARVLQMNGKVQQWD